MLFKKENKVIVLIMVLSILSGCFWGPTSIRAKDDQNYLCQTSVTLVVGEYRENNLRNYEGESVDNVKWSTSNKKVATVNRDGLIYARAKGSCKITALSNGKEYICKVKVKPSLSLSVKEMAKGCSDMEDCQFYLDNKNNLNILQPQRNFSNRTYEYNSFKCFREQSDGSMKITYRSWTRGAADKMKLNKKIGDSGENFILTQWLDESSGNLFFIACKYGFDESDTSESFLFGIDKKGNLICSKKIEDCLEIDKMSWYASGFSASYVGQKAGKAYISYSDNSKKALVIFDMKKKCFTKQLFCDGTVKAVYGNQVVCVSNDENNNTKKLLVENLPKGKEKKLSSGKKILTGNAIQDYQCDNSKLWGITVRDKYIYAIDKDNYMRMKIGDDTWTKLADVSEKSSDWNDGGDIYFYTILPKSKNLFYVVYYEDCSTGTNIKRIELE